MNLKGKFVSSIGLLGLLCLLVPGAAWADTVFQYTGSPYTICGGVYVCNGTTPFMFIKFDTTLTGAALDSLNNVTITTDLTSFLMEDSAQVVLSATTPIAILDEVNVIISTDSTGAITQWVVHAACSSSAQPVCTDPLAALEDGTSCLTTDINLVGFCGNSANVDNTLIDLLGGSSNSDALVLGADTPSSWTETSSGGSGGGGGTAVSEPSSLLLLGTGLLGLLALAARSKRHAIPTTR